jgi:hypothetical protein
MVVACVGAQMFGQEVLAMTLAAVESGACGDDRNVRLRRRPEVVLPVACHGVVRGVATLQLDIMDTCAVPAARSSRGTAST